jgi:hypothetical protein
MKVERALDSVKGLVRIGILYPDDAILERLKSQWVALELEIKTTRKERGGA